MTGQLNSNGLYRPVDPGTGEINPYRDAYLWNRCLMSWGSTLLMLPGLIFNIQGNDRIEYWWVQKAPNTAFAVTVWRGTQLCESIKISFHLAGEAQFDAWSQARVVLQPKPTDTVWNIACPSVNWGGVTQVGVKCVGTPKPVAGLSWDATIELIEYRKPVPIEAGPPDPPKQKSELAQENDRLAAETQALRNQIATGHETGKWK